MEEIETHINTLKEELAITKANSNGKCFVTIKCNGKLFGPDHIYNYIASISPPIRLYDKGNTEVAELNESELEFIISMLEGYLADCL